MKKFFTILFLILLVWPYSGFTQTTVIKPAGFSLSGNENTAVLSWKNPIDPSFSKVLLFRSTIPIEDYFSFGAVEGLCDKIYSGTEESYIDTGLATNLPYYYIIFASDKSGNYSNATVLEKKIISTTKDNNNSSQNNSTTGGTNSLSGASSNIVNQVTAHEAGLVFNFNQSTKSEPDANSKRLALFIIVKSPHDLSTNDKNAISYFIHEGTPTTLILGTGERAGVLNSYLSVFDKLPRNELEWQDIIKIANGRWPNEKSLESEKQASDEYFQAIYQRKADMNNPNDNAAVTVIAYGLRPSARNLESEKNAINIYRSIFNRAPTEATDWDLVRAIAYSGATR